MSGLDAATAPTASEYRGEQVRSRRQRAGLSQPELADLVRVEYARRTGLDLERADKPTRFDIIRWEKGQAPRDPDMLAALAHALSCGVDELVRPELSLSASDKAQLHAALEPLVNVLYDLVRQKVEDAS